MVKCIRYLILDCVISELRRTPLPHHHRMNNISWHIRQSRIQKVKTQYKNIRKQLKMLKHKSPALPTRDFMYILVYPAQYMCNSCCCFRYCCRLSLLSGCYLVRVRGIARKRERERDRVRVIVTLFFSLCSRSLFVVLHGIIIPDISFILNGNWKALFFIYRATTKCALWQPLPWVNWATTPTTAKLHWGKCALKLLKI